MDKIEALASITRISPSVVRVLGQNPGKFTLQGTNTYIVGKHNPFTLIDTGEGKEEYISVLESALLNTAVSTDPSEPHVSDIVISHWHRDHVGGIPTVLALLRRMWDEKRSPIPFKPPRLHKLPVPLSSLPDNSHNILPSILESLPQESFTPSPQGSVFHDLRDTQELIASSTNLHVLHTPGHTIDSISMYIPDDRALYTADSVLGQGTAVFEDLGTYISSLQKMLDFGSKTPFTILYPGHGPVVTEGPQLIETYIKHRLEREAQIVQVLQSTPPEFNPDQAGWTTWTVVSTIYKDYPESLWLPAARSVDLHMKKLQADRIIKKLDGQGVHTRWSLNTKL